MTEHPVVVEAVDRRAFAAAIGWPGWCRSGRDEQAALEHLSAAGARYSDVAREAGVTFGFSAGDGFAVVERVAGTSSTAFGVPGVVADVDRHPLPGAEAARSAQLLAASWRLLDRVAAGAPQELRKGPRGGGRDRDAIVRHVSAAEFAYARKIGVRHPEAADDPAAVEALRREVLDVLAAPSGEAPSTTKAKGWPHRYAVRRFAWHVLDHVWEIEDRIP